MEYRHYKVAPEPLSEEARRVLTSGRDEMMDTNKEGIMEYTKGEWTVDTESIATVVMAERTKVAVVYGYSDEEELANAHLIAAAPALYEALKILIQDVVPVGKSEFEHGKYYHGKFEVFGWRIEDALGALAEAEGK